MKLTTSKLFISLILITSMLNMTACSSHRNIDKPKAKIKNSSVSVKTNTIHRKNHNKSTASTKADYSAKDFLIPEGTPYPDIIKLKSITRKDAKLSTIPTLDFSRFDLNAQISNLINNPNQYNNQDFSNGIVRATYYDNMFIISGRYKLNIIQDIKIGTSFKYIINILGTPSINLNDLIVYKTKQYYLGFKGEGIANQAIAVKKPRTYNPNILKILLAEFNKKDSCGVEDSICNNKTISNFVDFRNVTGSGIYLATSLNGIDITGGCTDDIGIYNNFEGNLYKYDGPSGWFNITYKNEDFVAYLFSVKLNQYLDINKTFDTDGIVSPGGKFKSIYTWINGSDHYFTIRSLDFSCPDFCVYAATNEKDYSWLSDNYILYSHYIIGCPHIVKVSNYNRNNNSSIPEGSDINVLYKLKLISEDSDYDMGGYIECVKNSTIFLETSDESGNKTTYKIKYWFDKNGEIQLSL